MNTVCVHNRTLVKRVRGGELKSISKTDYEHYV